MQRTSLNQDCLYLSCMFTSQVCFLLIRLTWGQGLLELLSLLLVCDDQGVQVPAAAHLELNIVLVLLDLYGWREETSQIQIVRNVNSNLSES